MCGEVGVISGGCGAGEDRRGINGDDAGWSGWLVLQAFSLFLLFSSLIFLILSILFIYLVGGGILDDVVTE